jgi:hypothetical protein
MKNIGILIVTDLRGSFCIARCGDVWLGKEACTSNMHKSFISATNYSCYCLFCDTSLLSLPLLVLVPVQVFNLQNISLSVLWQQMCLNPYISNSGVYGETNYQFECIL